MRVLPRVKRRWRWLAAFIFLLWLAVLAADRLWPLPLHDVTPARVVVAEDGTPLWRFADAQGVWRYPVTLADVSPRYLQALIQYEDRWFWRHPGSIPSRCCAPPGRILLPGELSRAAARLPCRWHACLISIHAPSAASCASCGERCSWSGICQKSDILTLYLNRAPFGGTLQGDRRGQLGLSR